MSLWDQIQPYLDKETGLMTAADGGRDNLILMSAYLIRELLHLSEEEGVSNVFKSFYLFLPRVRVTCGLYLRRPFDTDDNSVDNLIGTCYFSQSAAQLILKRWRDYFTCFDVNHPTKIALNRNFYGRFVGLKAYILAASGITPGLFQRLLWCLSVWWSVHTSKGSSDPLLMSLQVDIMIQHCPRASLYWHKHYNLYDLYSQYFGPYHPLTLSRKEN